jgi:membrane fusion protein (multidrug efflux system)
LPRSADICVNELQPDNEAEFTKAEELSSEEARPEAVVGRKRDGAAVRRWALIMLLVGALLLIGWFIYHELRGRYYEGTNNAYVRADFVTVSPKIAGYVSAVYVANNQDVRAGQPLLKIDARDYRAQAAQSQAQIDVAQANADNVRATILEQRAAVDRAQADLAAASAKADFDAAQAARYAPLAASGAEPREKAAQLATSARDSAAVAASRRAALEMAERRIGSLRAQARQAESQGSAARAQLAVANVNLGATIIRASTNGRIGDKTVMVGQFVQPGTRLMSVVPLEEIYIEANFKETQIGLMRVGQPATIKVDALDGVKLRGRVESLSPGTGAQFSLLPPENATGNFTKIVQRVPVRIAILAGPEARKLLVPGLSVTATVDTISARGARRAIEAEQERLDDKPR